MAKEIDLAKREISREKKVSVEVFLIVIAITLAITAAVLVFVAHAPWYMVVDVLIGLAIHDAFLLLVGDIVQKKMKHPDKITPTYMIGFALFLVSVCMFLAGYKVKTILWLGIDWGVGAAFLAGGLVFYCKVIGHENELAQKTQNRLWKEKQKSYAETGMTEAEILEDAKKFLKYHLVGDILEGDLDFGNPFNDWDASVKDMELKSNLDPDTLTAVNYVTTLVHRFCNK